MEALDLRVNQYMAPTIEIVATEAINLEELIVACFHCDPSRNDGGTK